jgi:hypothetical protein
MSAELKGVAHAEELNDLVLSLKRQLLTARVDAARAR